MSNYSFVEVIKKFKEIMDGAGRKGNYCNGIPCNECPIETICHMQIGDKMMSNPNEFADFIMNYEPHVDWSKVEVNTPIFVSDSKDLIWHRRHFAKFEDGEVYAWDHGCTSFTSTLCTAWEFAKLANEGGMNNEQI